MSFYLDTSALVKLVAAEEHSGALRSWLEASETALVTSDLARTELVRAVRRVDATLTPRAHDVLDALTVLTATTAVFEDAALLAPDSLRSLDALHLASARLLGDDLDGLVTYDIRLAEAATSIGMRVIRPV